MNLTEKMDTKYAILCDVQIRAVYVLSSTIPFQIFALPYFIWMVMR